MQNKTPFSSSLSNALARSDTTTVIMPSHADMGKILELHEKEFNTNRPSVIDTYMNMILGDAESNQDEQEFIYRLSKDKNLAENLEQIKREIFSLYDHFKMDVVYYGTVPRKFGWTLYSNFQPEGNGLFDSSSTPGYRLAQTRGTDERDRYRIYLENISVDGNIL